MVFSAFLLFVCAANYKLVSKKISCKVRDFMKFLFSIIFLYNGAKSVPKTFGIANRKEEHFGEQG